MVGTRMCYPVMDFGKQGSLPRKAELKNEPEENLLNNNRDNYP